MKRWSVQTRCEVEDAKVDAFIEDVIAVCRQHGMSLGHEDGHGAFIVEAPDETNFTWLRSAFTGLPST